MSPEIPITKDLSLVNISEKKWEVRTRIRYNGGYLVTGKVYETEGKWHFQPKKGKIPVVFENFSSTLKWLREC